MKPIRRSALAVLALAAAIAPACNEGTPVAPKGTVLHLAAYPTRIGKTGTSALTIQALRSNGNPVNPGTEIRLSSSIGVVESVVYTDNDGVAHGTLRGDGRVGTATVAAYSGGTETVTTEVAVGALATAISLSVDPTSLPESGGRVDLIALVRDDQGQPLPDATVNFRTEAGSLASGGAFLTTDVNGQATDRLNVSSADTQSQPDRLITVTVESGGTGGVISASKDISIQAPPQASFTFSIAANAIVTFTETSTGTPTAWHWDFGDGAQSTQRSPVHQYPGVGQYIATLRASNAFGSSEASALINIQ